MTVHILGGGTFSYVRSHLSIAAPAFGKTARFIHALYANSSPVKMSDGGQGYGVWNNSKLHLTKMADHESDIVTNDDVAAFVDGLVADPETRVIYFNVALCDFTGSVFDDSEDIESGKYAKRLKSRDYEPVEGCYFGEPIHLRMADKIISRIRKERKDIFVIGFKTTTGATSDQQYLAGLNLLKANSINLVVTNDTVTRNNMIIAPEETRYCETTDRGDVIRMLVKMVKARSTNTFTRSTVVDGDLVDFQTDTRVPDNLRQVVNYLVKRGAYKEFRNSTVGHFAVRLEEGKCLTSRRKTNYTKPGGLDLVQIDYDGSDRVIAHGAKPSVGGQSQRLIFSTFPEMDAIAHAHVPLRSDAVDDIPVASQQWNECGSHQCAQNCVNNFKEFDHSIKAVMMSDHGPNVTFSRETPAQAVIDFFERNFALEAKTGGLVSA